MSPTSDSAIAESLEFEKTFHLTDDKPEVSVIVTCYNHSNFIEECLTSIFTQEADFLFEVLIGDDASTDDSLEKIEAIAQDWFTSKTEHQITEEEIFRDVVRKRHLISLAQSKGNKPTTETVLIEKDGLYRGLVREFVS